MRSRTIGILSRTADEAAIETAYSLAARLGARVVDTDRHVDLVIVGSRAEARDGHVMITSAAENALEDVTAPVLIVARGVGAAFRHARHRLAHPARLSLPRPGVRRGARGRGVELYRAPPCAR